jgi:hypothetical protein
MDNPIQRDWLEYRSKIHEMGHRFNSRYAQQKLKNVTRDPEETLRYLARVYDTTAAAAVKAVTDHESAVACGERLDEFGNAFIRQSLALIRSGLGPDRRTDAKDLVSRLGRQLLPRSEYWKAEAHKRALQGARAAQLEGSPPQRTRKGDLCLLEGKVHVTLRIAALYVGVTQRRIQQAIRDKKLVATGSKGNRMVPVDSLKRYQPPLNEQCE